MKQSKEVTLISRIYQNQLIRSEMYKLLDTFERLGIQVIVLKGIRLSERFLDICRAGEHPISICLYG